MKKLISLIIALTFVASLCASFAPPALADGALPAILDSAEVALRDGYLLGVAAGSSAADVKSYFDGEVKVCDGTGTERADGETVASGWLAASGETAAVILIAGELNGDSKINVRDVIALMRFFVGKDEPDYDIVADTVPDGTVNARDVIALMRYIVGYDVVLGERFFKVNTERVAAPSEDASLALFFEDSLQKDARVFSQSIEVVFADTIGTQTPVENANIDVAAYEMKLARNEKESCQVELYSASGHNGLSASLTPFKNGRGETLDSQLLFVDYIRLMDTGGTLQGTGKFTGAVVPDALPPMPDTFNINAGERQGLYIEVSANESTPAGLYRATLTVNNAAGETVKTANVYATVWDFTLPVESHTKTAFGMGMWGLLFRAGKYDDLSDNGIGLYIQYYEYLLDNRLNGWCLPYNPINDEADRWMDDPRVNTFLVAGGYSGDMYNNGGCGGAVEEQTVAAIYDKIKDNETWMKKQMFYMTDEPGIIWVGDEWGGQDKLHQAEDVYETLLRVFPGARINIPVAKDFFQDTYQEYISASGTFRPGGDRWGWGHVDTLDVCARFSNVMCPCIDIMSTPAVDLPDTFNYQYTKEHERLYGTMVDRLDAWRNEGKEIWWYTANSPHPPMANISQRCTGVQNRVMFWEMYKYGVEGFLYWATQDWGAKKRHQIDIDGGVLMYPGSEYDTAGCVACQRTGILRDGIEDVEYFYIAEELLGREWVDSFIERVVRTVNDFEQESEALLSVRNELGDAIEKALAE